MTCSLEAFQDAVADGPGVRYLFQEAAVLVDTRYVERVGKSSNRDDEFIIRNVESLLTVFFDVDVAVACFDFDLAYVSIDAKEVRRG